MTRRERMERRLERRREWAQTRAKDSERRFNTAHGCLDGIPPGQPILIGHHSEKRHRAALDRHDTNMRAAFESKAMAQRHEQVADTLESNLEHTIFSDDANALEAIQARIQEREAACERIKALNVAIRREFKTGLTEGWLDRIGATEKEREAILRNTKFGKSPLFQPYTLSNMRGRIKADKDRMKSIQRQQERTAAADAAGGLLVQRHPEINWCTVTFAEKPPRETINALKDAGYRWGAGSWCGYLDKLPACIV